MIALDRNVNVNINLNATRVTFIVSNDARIFYQLVCLVWFVLKTVEDDHADLSLKGFGNIGHVGHLNLKNIYLFARSYA